jgi:hypothetical protein
VAIRRGLLDGEEHVAGLDDHDDVVAGRQPELVGGFLGDGRGTAA